jgi:hypothetical protein
MPAGQTDEAKTPETQRSRAGGGGGQKSPLESQKKHSWQGRSRVVIVGPQDPEEEIWQG